MWLYWRQVVVDVQQLWRVPRAEGVGNCCAGWAVCGQRSALQEQWHHIQVSVDRGRSSSGGKCIEHDVWHIFTHTLQSIPIIAPYIYDARYHVHPYILLALRHLKCCLDYIVSEISLEIQHNPHTHRTQHVIIHYSTGHVFEQQRCKMKAKTIHPVIKKETKLIIIAPQTAVGQLLCEVVHTQLKYTRARLHA